MLVPKVLAITTAPQGNIAVAQFQDSAAPSHTTDPMGSIWVAAHPLVVRDRFTALMVSTLGKVHLVSAVANPSTVQMVGIKVAARRLVESSRTTARPINIKVGVLLLETVVLPTDPTGNTRVEPRGSAGSFIASLCRYRFC